jgi:hypothetical protein
VRFRKLRIAWSIGWGLLATLLCVLWVRSYRTLDNVAGHLPGVNAVSCTSAYGRVAVGVVNQAAPWKWNMHSNVLDETSYGGPPKGPRRWFVMHKSPAHSGLAVPHGFLMLLAAFSVGLPWMPWRFSLRALLIATTIVGVLLGAVIWRDGRI